MDYEDIGNLTLTNLTDDYVITPEASSRFIGHEIIFTLFCIVGICADSAIIYTIFRFKRIHTIPHIFLANWAIADLCSLVVTPSSYRIISIIDHISMSQEFMCTLYEGGLILHITVVVFVTLVSIDWVIAAYFRRASEKFRNHYKYIIGSIWILTLLMGSISIGLCINDVFWSMLEFMLLCTCSACLLVVVVLQCSRAVQKCRRRPMDYPTLMLTLASAFVISYLLAFLNLIVLHATYYHPLLGILSACSVFSSSIVNLALLYVFNKDFQACFLQAIRRTGGRYEDTISEFDNPASAADNGKYSVQVAFHNPTEELLTNAY